jgi:hypothetical protein
MARARKRTSESVEDSKLLRERRGRPRSRGRAHRRLADPVDFLRRVRYFAQYVNGTWDQTAWEDEKTDLLFRCAAIDPCLESMSPAEATAGESRRDQDTATVVAGVSHLPVTAIEDPQRRRLAFAVTGIRRILERIKGAVHVTEADRRDLCLLADGVQRAIAESTTLLSPLARSTWDLLLKQPQDRPLTSAQIMAKLADAEVLCEASHLRRELAGPLADRGVRNERGLGYFVPEELRPSERAH